MYIIKDYITLNTLEVIKTLQNCNGKKQFINLVETSMYIPFQITDQYRLNLHKNISNIQNSHMLEYSKQLYNQVFPY